MSRTKVIWADSLLIVNFSMDFLALYIMIKLQNGVVYPKKMTIAAVIGAVWALVEVLIEAYIAAPVWRIFMVAADIACASVISSVAAGDRSVSLKRTMVFVAINVGLGGIMTAMYDFVGSIVGQPIYSVGQTDSSSVLFITAAVIAGAVSLAYGKFRTRTASQKRVKLTLAAFGTQSTIDVLCDSGNLLCEPFSGKPVIVLCARRMDGILPSELIDAARSYDNIGTLSEKMLGKVRLIPTNSVTGKRMMLCFIPERIDIDGEVVDAVAALDTCSTDYDGCDGIIPQILLSV